MTRKPLIIPLNTAAENATPVYLFAGRGGNAKGYAALAETLTPDWQVNGVLYPLFVGCNVSYETVEALAEAMLPDVAALPDPIILGGYSMGGAVAYEIACQLEQRGRQAIVVMIDTRIDYLMKEPEGPRKFLRHWLVRWPRRIARHLGVMKPRTQLAANTWRPRDAKQAAFFSLFGKILRSYVPTKSNVRIVMVKAGRKPRTAWLSTRYWPTRAYGWHRVAKVSQIIYCTGNHFSIVKPSHQAALAQALSSAFLRAEQVLAKTKRSNGAVRED